MTKEEISWDDAVTSDKFIRFEPDEAKTLVITNWVLQRRPEDAKVGAGEIEFDADVVEENGEPTEKKLNTTSKRLKLKLKKILENKKDAAERVKISIMKVGEKFDTQYSVVEKQ